MSIFLNWICATYYTSSIFLYCQKIFLDKQLLKALDKKVMTSTSIFFEKILGYLTMQPKGEYVAFFQTNKSFFFSLAEREYDTKIVQKYKKFLGFSEPNISYIGHFSSVAM